MDNRIFISGEIAMIEVYHKKSERNFYVLVDTEDLELIQSTKSLYIGIELCTNYCLYRTEENQNYMRLHRLIMKTPQDLVVDHINHNGLDNRKKNLRNTTLKGNRANILKGNRNPLWIQRRKSKWLNNV